MTTETSFRPAELVNRLGAEFGSVVSELLRLPELEAVMILGETCPRHLSGVPDRQDDDEAASRTLGAWAQSLAAEIGLETPSEGQGMPIELTPDESDRWTQLVVAFGAGPYV